LTAQGIDARDIHKIRVADFKGAILSSVRHVVRQTDTVECVLAITLVSSRVADLYTGHVTTDKIVPMVNLLICDTIWTESSRINQTTHRISVQILSTAIKFTTKVLCVDVDVHLIGVSNHLNVLRSIEDLKTREGTGSEYPGTMTAVAAPGDFNALRVSDRRIWRPGSENTEIKDIINDRSLTLGLLVLSGRIANIVPRLSPANIGTGNGLVGQSTRI